MIENTSKRTDGRRTNGRFFELRCKKNRKNVFYLKIKMYICTETFDTKIIKL